MRTLGLVHVCNYLFVSESKKLFTYFFLSNWSRLILRSLARITFLFLFSNFKTVSVLLLGVYVLHLLQCLNSYSPHHLKSTWYKFAFLTQCFLNRPSSRKCGISYYRKLRNRFTKNYSHLVIISFNTSLENTAFYTYSFGKRVFFLSAFHFVLSL